MLSLITYQLGEKTIFLVSRFNNELYNQIVSISIRSRII